jgi:hypothetical protein
MMGQVIAIAGTASGCAVFRCEDALVLGLSMAPGAAGLPAPRQEQICEKFELQFFTGWIEELQ